MNDHRPTLSLRADMVRMNKAELAGVIVDTEREIRQSLAKQAAALAEIDARGVLAETGYSDLSTLVVDLIHIDGRAAKKRIDRAAGLFARPGMSGGEIPAVAPQAADALATGAIGPEHVDPIQHALTDLPADVSDARRENVEAELVKLASTTTPQHVAKAGRRARDVLDPDGPAPDEREHAQPARAVRAGWLRDGRYGLSGELDAETGKLFERLMSPLAKPQPAEDGTRDARTTDERRADAFADLLERVQRSLEMPTEAGERPTIVVVTMNLNDLTAELDGDPITAGQARRFACDSDVIPAVLRSDSEVLDLGRSRRLVSPAQRRALNLRDKGCIKCGRPPQWCHAHHIKHWIDGGDTDLNNLCLLCTSCHRLVHHAGWKIITKPKTKPECQPPGWMPLIA